jgi:stage II sporulation protein Q
VNNLKRKLKGFVLPVLSGLIIGLLLVTYLSFNSREVTPISNDFKFVSSKIINNTLPVLSYDDVLIRPYQTNKINVIKRFYDENNKELGILYFKDTYIQCTGILYNSDEEYNVVSILDGQVINVSKDDLLGNTVEIRHTDNLISSYQGLKNVYVKKGDYINQNTIIGKSGDIKLNETYNNALLFELIKDGHYINPDKYFDKKIKEL